MEIKARAWFIGSLFAILAAGSANAMPFQEGDVFAAVGDGNIDRYDSSGAFLGTLNIGSSGFTTGMTFDGAGNLYATGFSSSTLAKFDINGNLLNADFTSGGLATPESVVIDQAGDIYVGNLSNGIRKYDTSGSFLGTVIGGRVDWFDLAADQSTILYGQEGSAVKTVSNGLPGTPGADFTNSAVNAFAMRILSDGGLLLADRDDVKRFDSTGALIQSYDNLGGTSSGWFALNLDPDGSSFWSGSFSDGLLHKIDIASGALLQTINTGSSAFFGVAVFGEITAGGPGPGPDPEPVPEPSVLILLGIGLGGLAFSRRLKRRAC